MHNEKKEKNNSMHNKKERKMRTCITRKNNKGKKRKHKWSRKGRWSDRETLVGQSQNYGSNLSGSNFHCFFSCLINGAAIDKIDQA